MTYRDYLFHQELMVQRDERDRYMAQAHVASLLIAVCERELGYSADCQQALDMISEGSPVENSL